MALRYSAREMADMVYCYGLADGNSRHARILYAEKYPIRQIPSNKLFTNLFLRLKETGSLLPKRRDGVQSSIRTPNVEERVLRRAEENRELSIRKIAAAEGISRSMVWSILQDYNYSEWKAEDM